ncbi:HDIG domain-containing protein [Desulfovibrio sp. OttesenSCG-928-F07]|nr:HDIG domain-containing protein [Desulfovibrio sp. OttesenSCG-928-F07]
MTQKKVLPDGQSRRIQTAIEFLRRYQLGTGFWTLIVMLAVVSFIVTFEWGPAPRAYVLGEIAEQDVMATRSFSFRDNDATKLKREAVQKAQPVICTLNVEPIDSMHRMVKDWFLEASKAEDDPRLLDLLRAHVSDTIGEDLSTRQVMLFAHPEFQHILTNLVLPWADQKLRDGVISDARKLTPYSGGVIIRNLESGEETLHQDIRSVPDIKDFLLDLEREVRVLPTTLQIKKLIISMVGNMAVSTLTINEEATRQRATDAAKAVPNVVQHISEGEIIVRQGEKIDAEQLVKLQALWKRNVDRFKPQFFAGVFLLSLLICVGLFFSPNGRQMSNIRQKDLVFIGCLVLFMALLTKAFYLIGFVFSMSSAGFTAGAQAFAVPVAGAVALTGLALNNKRYYITCMLVSFFCTIVCKGGIGLFLFYFMSGMLGTWLVIDSQNRKEVVWAMLPLTGGLIAVWLAATLLQGGEYNRFVAEALAIALGSFLSIVVIFALSPVIEMVFGFTTRFALMELLNQEHPALRQLMIDAPGTYHHSIIVANMVEPAAKAIGAHSLLAKVGAIYHDIGKVEKAEYFIENQFHRSNPHDKLTPAMSALVLISHVKRGTELAMQYKLGSEITDIITQHHGTSVIRYFFHKAKGLDSSVTEANFSYAGPKPQSREAALIMLADVVEASSRTLADPTPSRIRAHVQKIIRGVFAEGQLDNTELTFKDLDKVAENFVLILTGIFHKRIEYPDKVPPKPNLQELPAPVPADAEKEDYHAVQWVTPEENNGQSAAIAAKKAAAQARHVKMPQRAKHTHVTAQTKPAAEKTSRPARPKPKAKPGRGSRPLKGGQA